MVLRIDKLAPFTKVELQFHGTKWERIEPAVFVKMHGAGEDRQAEFISIDPVDGHDYSWHAYRWQGHWSYGTSGGRLQLIRVIG